MPISNIELRNGCKKGDENYKIVPWVYKGKKRNLYIYVYVNKDGLLFETNKCSLQECRAWKNNWVRHLKKYKEKE